MLRTAIVVTTIGAGEFCETLQPVLEQAGGAAALIVIGDQKTPPACAEAVQRLRTDGHDVTWFGVAEQRRWLTQVPDFARHIPWNSDNRRNIGFLEAWRRGFEAVISMDDDNHPVSSAGFFERGLDFPPATEIVTDARWINVCELLDCRSRRDGTPLHVFPRGHPLSRRSASQLAFADAGTRQRAVLHVGLWLDEPDVDAATRAAVAPEATAGRIDAPVLMPPGALAGISSQNLCAARRLIPAWWFARMGRVAGAVTIDRYGDMLQGYFAAMAIAAMGERISVGPPLLRHERNAHSLAADLAVELPGMMLVEAMLPLLEAARRPVTNYAEAYLAITHDLTDWARTARPRLWGDALPRWADRTAETMAAWVEACRTLDPEPHAASR